MQVPTYKLPYQAAQFQSKASWFRKIAANDKLGPADKLAELLTVHSTIKQMADENLAYYQQAILDQQLTSS